MTPCRACNGFAAVKVLIDGEWVLRNCPICAGRGAISEACSELLESILAA